METDVLRQLDERIQASLNRIQQLQRESEQLAQRLAESEQRFNELSARVREHEEARNQIKLRIESILARFDGLDLGLSVKGMLKSWASSSSSPVMAVTNGRNAGRGG